MQAKLEVSCFKRFGLDLPLKPGENKYRLIIYQNNYNRV